MDETDGRAEINESRQLERNNFASAVAYLALAFWQASECLKEEAEAEESCAVAQSASWKPSWPEEKMAAHELR